MRASDVEFRHRFWIISGIFFLGFACYTFDHVTTGAALARALGGADDRAAHVVFEFGALLVVLAALLRTWAAAYLQTAVVKDGAVHSDRLVADGPYRHLRNPLYLGTILLAVALGLIASRLGFAVMVLGMILFVMRLIGREEAALTLSQGTGYAAYQAAVPSLIPALRPRVPAGALEPRWGQAFAGELMMWAFAAGAAVFAVTLQIKVLYIFLIAGFVGYLPGRTMRKGSV
jgi:protein-S-isoprenylcysteine O-methyltransferase Ste14